MNRKCILCIRTRHGYTCCGLNQAICVGTKDTECSFYKSRDKYYRDNNGYIQPLKINKGGHNYGKENK